MGLLSFVLQVLAATTLLLYSVRMIQTGIDRAYGANFRARLSATTSVPGSFMIGIIIALVMQSSIAVAGLASVMAGTGILQFGTALAIVVGADLGSAIMVQVLSLNLQWLAPLLMFAGGTMFLRSDVRKTKQIGRVLLGVALVLVSLQLIRTAVAPIAASDALPLLSEIFEKDAVTAFLIGGCLAFAMHSSLATILMILTFVSTGFISLEAGVFLVLGANFGSALVPVWLCRGMNSMSRRVPWGNFVFRGVGAVIYLFVMRNIMQSVDVSGMSEAQALVALHVIFNTSLILALPLRHAVGRLVEHMINTDQQNSEPKDINHRSVLDFNIIANTDLALANLRREVLRMSYLVSSMIDPLILMLKNCDNESQAELKRENNHLSDAFDMVRNYVSALSAIELQKKQKKQVRNLFEYATQLSRTGEIIVNNLLPGIEDDAKAGIQFSTAGEEELMEIHEKLKANIAISSNLLLAIEINTAKLVIENKDEISKLLRKSQKMHFERIRKGSGQSVQSSNMHLEILHSFREINGRVASVAYPQLEKADLLTESRLVMGELTKDTPSS
jgi:phosphate:Na+ symporter